MGEFRLGRSVPMANRRVGELIVEGLKVEDPAACYAWFHGGAVFFDTGLKLPNHYSIEK